MKQMHCKSTTQLPTHSILKAKDSSVYGDKSTLPCLPLANNSIGAIAKQKLNFKSSRQPLKNSEMTGLSKVNINTGRIRFRNSQIPSESLVNESKFERSLESFINVENECRRRPFQIPKKPCHSRSTQMFSQATIFEEEMGRHEDSLDSIVILMGF